MIKDSGLVSRIPEIDGLRGIAILSVIAFHYLNNQLLYAGNTMGKLLCAITSFGWVGVDLFFVLSGFLITSVLLKGQREKTPIGNFFVRRMARIFPSYFLFLVVFWSVSSLDIFSDNYMLSGNMVLPLWSYFAFVHNIYMASLHNMGNSSLSITWSIGVEEQFYLVFPWIVQYLMRGILPYFLLALAGAAILFRMQYQHWIPGYVLLTSRMDALAMGALVAYWKEYGILERLFLPRQMVILVIMLLDIGCCGMLYYSFGDLGIFKHTLFGIFFSSCLILALLQTPLYSTVLRFNFLRWVGKISYPLYLFHYFVLALVHDFLGNKGLVISTTQDVVGTVAALLISVLVAWCIYLYLESPVVRWAKMIRVN